MPTRSQSRFFYAVFLPLSVAANVGLGLAVLMQLRPVGWLGWLEIATGGFCFAVVGWLAGSAWSKSYWGSAMAYQVMAWRQIADAIFAWMEEVPLPAEALHRLKTSLDDAMRSPSSRTVEPADQAPRSAH
jgi:hypothetical protein